MLKKGPLSLAKTEPTSPLTPFEEFERRFEDFFRRPFSMMESPWWARWPGLAGEVSPAMDIYEEQPVGQSVDPIQVEMICAAWNEMP
ncbi:MAG TPA: hypothetical protein VK187_04205, partial [Geobacteraceae bacterium]|nr:hypothetical protein [Geobacteraceae bacterium]